MIISIIVATYNSASTIGSTLESILSQTYKSLECVIIDGRSQDNTLDIVKEYEGRFEGRLKWISEPDRGLYDAMNKGLSMATGDVVGILNSDDFYTSDDVLERVANEIEDFDAVYGDIHFVNPDVLSKCVRYYSSRSFRPWQMRFGFMPAHPSFYCRRRVYQTLGVFDLQFKVAADFEQLLRLIYVNRISTKYIPMDFVTMRTGGASTSGLQSHKAILRDHLRAYHKNGVRAYIVTEGFRYIYRILQQIFYKINIII